jgi:hypothetical protein
MQALTPVTKHCPEPNSQKLASQSLSVLFTVIVALVVVFVPVVAVVDVVLAVVVVIVVLLAQIK